MSIVKEHKNIEIKWRMNMLKLECNMNLMFSISVI